MLRVTRYLSPSKTAEVDVSRYSRFTDLIVDFHLFPTGPWKFDNSTPLILLLQLILLLFSLLLLLLILLLFRHLVGTSSFFIIFTRKGLPLFFLKEGFFLQSLYFLSHRRALPSISFSPPSLPSLLLLFILFFHL